MREITIKLYQFHELSEKAQRRAWETGPDFSDEHGDEYRATLAAFEKYFDIKVYRWSVDNWNYDFAYVTAGRATEAPENDALRLARYIWNNYAEYITTGKYYSTGGRWIDGKYNYKSRRSRATFEMGNCPFTGCVTDCAILDPVIDCLRYKRFFSTYEDLINTCLANFFRAWRDEIEYCSGFEHFAEMCELYEYEFYETGELA